jgi:hypothetical protein
MPYSIGVLAFSLTPHIQHGNRVWCYDAPLPAAPLPASTMEAHPHGAGVCYLPPCVDMEPGRVVQQEAATRPSALAYPGQSAPAGAAAAPVTERPGPDPRSGINAAPARHNADRGDVVGGSGMGGAQGARPGLLYAARLPGAEALDVRPEERGVRAVWWKNCSARAASKPHGSVHIRSFVGSGQ